LKNQRESSSDQNWIKKTIAEFKNGIRMGIGFVFERTCGPDCGVCNSQKTCRLFLFRSHHDIYIRGNPEAGPDSFSQFRSDFVHFSLSLTSPVKERITLFNAASSVHLSGLTFAHFWHWWELFDNTLSLPIMQGKLFPDARPTTPKFGQHLATIKYRISVSKLFISHVYAQDAVGAWDEGISRMVGIKLGVSDFQADLHQRDQLMDATHDHPPRHQKVFNAAEVTTEDISLVAMYAVFRETRCESQSDTDRTKSPWDEMAQLEPESKWASMNDWIELDWDRREEPEIYIADIANCPYFVYFKTAPSIVNHDRTEKQKPSESRFQGEDTHSCMMGSELGIKRHSLLEISYIHLTQELLKFKKCCRNEGLATFVKN
jgi:hypothetical protein